MDEKGNLIVNIKPTLRNPYIICGLTGWVDGGEVSTGVVEYFIEQFKGKTFAEIPNSRYYVYQVPGEESLRPIFKMQEGLIVETQFPKNEFYYAVNPDSDRDLIFFRGTEPSLYWEEYADTVISLACSFGAARLYVSGGVLDSTPYTREPVISCACTSSKVKKEMEKYNVTFSSREGPATFNQMLLFASKRKNLEGMSLTARVPYYPEYEVALDYSAKSIEAILARLNNLMRLNINFTELNKEIKETERSLDLIRQQNPEFNAYIEELENNYLETQYHDPLNISPKEGIKLAEDFLRTNKYKPHGDNSAGG
jgi:proteasome assembly chaperone (PAC2) family protein